MFNLFRKKRERLANRFEISPPVAQPGRSGLAIVLIVKDEAKDIADWVRFHCLAGMAHLFLYDNGSTDGTAQLAQEACTVPITVIPWQLNVTARKADWRMHQQALAYSHAILTYGAGFARMAFIDTDEFLVPRHGHSIEAAIAHLGDCANISLPWVMFGHNGHVDVSDLPLPFAFTQRARHLGGKFLNFKCIVDPCAVKCVGLHRFETDVMGTQTRNTNGAFAHVKQRTGDFVTTDHLQLNHYYLRSKAELQAKLDRGDAPGTSLARREFATLRNARLIEADTVQDDTALAFLARHGINDPASFRGDL